MKYPISERLLENIRTSLNSINLGGSKGDTNAVGVFGHLNVLLCDGSHLYRKIMETGVSMSRMTTSVENDFVAVSQSKSLIGAKIEISYARRCYRVV